MMKFQKILTLFTILLLLFSMQSFSITIKLASIAPENSPWGEALNKLAVEWERISDGEVKLVVYHNGVLGKESDMLQKMRIGQVQGGVFTSFGLIELAPEILCVSYPFLIHDDGELDYVMKRVEPLLNSSIEKKNFVVMAWHKAGWVRFFSTNKIIVPQDLKAHKVISNPDDQAFSQIWKEMGYHQVPVAIPDVLQALNSGLVNAMWASPLGVASYQWFGITKNMTSLKVAPFLGSIIVSKSAWQRIPERFRARLKQAVVAAALELDTSIPAKEAEAIAIMQRYGLVINQISPENEKLWAEEFARGAVPAIGKMFPREVYDLVRGYLKEYRGK
jgi:TRAP-type C4-dicarboxylate transport system substrate-binding protein